MAPLPTCFAPAERSDHKTLLSDSAFFMNYEPLHNIINAIPFIGLILNEQRQLVFSNESLSEAIGVKGIEKLLGKRPGELLNCENAKLEPGGCGTSEFCQVCGAARVIMESLITGNRASGECRITSGNGSIKKAYDFKCVATPFCINNKAFTVLSLLDISHEKRRRAMERIFFHDIINTAAGLDGFINYIREINEQDNTRKQIEIVRRLSRRLLDEIVAQRELSDAENGELNVRKQDVFSLDLVSDVVNFMAYHNITESRIIITDPGSDNSRFRSDPTLLRRVLINMLKNALEACPPSGEIIIGCNNGGSNTIFWVQNPGIIPPEVRKQIFQRSFSTKGDDRGLGTYSMRLLTEKYLRGRISFDSNEKSGTIFRLSVPVD